MILRMFLALALAFAVSGCGTKSNLDLPNGKPTPKNQHDPSQPPNPIVR
jgi:predicted small lipoprotein YifL